MAGDQRQAALPATLNDYRTIVETKLKPALGKLRLPQLDPVTLDRFYGQLRRRAERLRFTTVVRR